MIGLRPLLRRSQGDAPSNQDFYDPNRRICPVVHLWILLYYFKYTRFQNAYDSESGENQILQEI